MVAGTKVFRKIPGRFCPGIFNGMRYESCSDSNKSLADLLRAKVIQEETVMLYAIVGITYQKKLEKNKKMS